MTCFGLKLGQDLGNRAAHPYREFRGVPPRGNNFLQLSETSLPHALCSVVVRQAERMKMNEYNERMSERMNEGTNSQMNGRTNE